jgi:hypothetical protein
MVPDSREREIKQHLGPGGTTSCVSTDELLSSLKSLCNVQHFTIRNADTREFPPSVFHYLTPKLGIFDSEKLKVDFKPLGYMDTQIENDFQIYSSFLAYGQAFERCEIFSAEMNPMSWHRHDLNKATASR